jgi:hypothetical protein
MKKEYKNETKRKGGIRQTKKSERKSSLKEENPAMDNYYHDPEKSKKILKYTAIPEEKFDWELPIELVEGIYADVWSARKNQIPKIILKESSEQYRKRKKREYHENHKNNQEYVKNRANYNREYQKINKDKINARRRKNRREKLK